VFASSGRLASLAFLSRGSLSLLPAAFSPHPALTHHLLLKEKAKKERRYTPPFLQLEGFMTFTSSVDCGASFSSRRSLYDITSSGSYALPPP